jgi:hypothetical protein
MNPKSPSMKPLNDDQLDDALADLRSELAIEPSPEFAAKVRRQIDQAPAPSFGNVWTWAAIAMTSAVVFVAGSLWLRSGDTTGALPGAPTTDPVAASSFAQQMTTTPTALPTPTTTPTSTLTATATSTANDRSGSATFAGKKPAAVTAAATKTEPEVLVPTDQLDAIRQLMSAVRRGAVKDMPVLPSVIDPKTGEILEPKPIEIPLITVEPLPGTVEGRSGGSGRK